MAYAKNSNAQDSGQPRPGGSNAAGSDVYRAHLDGSGPNLYGNGVTEENSGKNAWMDKSFHVGRPNIGDRERLLERINDILDRRWLTNGGPY